MNHRRPYPCIGLDVDIDRLQRPTQHLLGCRRGLTLAGAGVEQYPNVLDRGDQVVLYPLPPEPPPPQNGVSPHIVTTQNGVSPHIVTRHYEVSPHISAIRRWEMSSV